MNTKEIVRAFYFFYSVYVLMVINATTLTFADVVPAIMVLWLNYAFFSLGYSYRKEVVDQSVPDRSWLLECGRSRLAFMALLSLVCSIVAAKYYTGQTPITVIRSVVENVSVYNRYQQYFLDQVRGTALIAKAPFILMMFYVKFLLFHSYSSVLLSPRRLTWFRKAYLALVAMSYIYFGIARGTSFEVFEVALLGVFVGLTRRVNQRRTRLRAATVIKVMAITVAAIAFFNVGIRARGVVFNYAISNDVSYDQNGLLSILSPFVSFVTVAIYGYFGFGFFYVSMYMKEVWFRQVGSLIAGLLPFGLKTLGISNIREVMGEVVDMGAKWHPDAALLMGNVGYLGLIVFCFLLGAFAKYVRTVRDGGSATYLTSFMIVLEMISLPVGNFIWTSSSSGLIALALTVYWLWRGLKRGVLQVKLRMRSAKMG